MEIALRVAEIARGDFDVIEPDHRIDIDVGDLGALPHYLSVYLAIGWNVYNDVVEDLQLTAEPVSGGEGTRSPVVEFAGAGRSDPGLVEGNRLR